VKKRQRLSIEVFEILGQPPAPTEPRKGSFDGSGANSMDGRETECRRSLADQAASTAVHISGAVLLSAGSLPNANWPFLIRCMSSIPAIVIDARRNRLNPSMGPNEA